MKLIINTTTLSGTGVTQVAVSFINECRKYPENNYYVFLSKKVAKEINLKLFPDNFKFYFFESHPLYGIKGYKVRKRLRKLENQIKPDKIFTVFGPSCWTPKQKHLSGFANSYYVYPESDFFKFISLKERLRININKLAHRFFLKKNGNYFVCETEDMSKRLQNFLKIKRENIFTVSNTFNSFFENPTIENEALILSENKNDEFRLLCLASFDIHKNLTIINLVVPLLLDKRPNFKFKFILTIENQKYIENFTEVARQHIINIGRIDVKLCPQLYSECNALFLPSLIESFSANYPEAMKMEIPILTSNYSFAKSICEEAAVYYDPLNPEDIANKIIDISESEDKKNVLIERGKLRVKTFGNAETRAKKYLEILKNI